MHTHSSTQTHTHLTHTHALFPAPDVPGRDGQHVQDGAGSPLPAAEGRARHQTSTHRRTHGRRVLSQGYSTPLQGAHAHVWVVRFPSQFCNTLKQTQGHLGPGSPDLERTMPAPPNSSVQRIVTRGDRDCVPTSFLELFVALFS